MLCMPSQQPRIQQVFTGIIQAVGEIVVATPVGGDLRLRVRSKTLPLDDVQLGDSIATNGVCLTVIELPGDGYVADVSRETLAHTTVGQWKSGSRVNLEKAMRPTDRLGGHIVSGHVDAVGDVISIKTDARATQYRIRAPQTIARYIAHKGSITVDGVSLTVNAINGSEFDLTIVPHTQVCTMIGDYIVGSKVNLEVDVLARYLERLLTAGGDEKTPAEGLSLEVLARHGFYSGK
jgi:riboflavin synthase